MCDVRRRFTTGLLTSVDSIIIMGTVLSGTLECRWNHKVRIKVFIADDEGVVGEGLRCS